MHTFPPGSDDSSVDFFRSLALVCVFIFVHSSGFYRLSVQKCSAILPRSEQHNALIINQLRNPWHFGTRNASLFPAWQVG
jgi:hypothetical protein